MPESKQALAENRTRYGVIFNNEDFQRETGLNWSGSQRNPRVSRKRSPSNL
jgi:hypothetical protein